MRRPMAVRTTVTTMRIVEAALTSGVTEKRSIEYTFTGNVTVSGPAVKKVMTKSSSDKVKARSAPAIRPGCMCGTSTSQNVRHSLAPRSLAASSSSRLNEERRARTTVATNGNAKEVWAMIMAPRLSGQGSPIGQGTTRAKNTSMATPMQISGTTIGSAIEPSTTVLPGKRKRHSITAASAPRTTEKIVQKKAMVSELTKAWISDSLLSAFT